MCSINDDITEGDYNVWYLFDMNEPKRRELTLYEHNGTQWGIQLDKT